MNFFIWYLLLPGINGYALGSVFRVAFPAWTGLFPILFLAIGIVLYYFEGKKETNRRKAYSELLLRAGIAYKEHYGLLEESKRIIALTVMIILFLAAFYKQ